MPYKDKQKQLEYQNNWMRKRRAKFFVGKRCMWCNTKHKLELHHADPDQKEHHAIWSWNEVRRLKEIEKCIVLCRECHQNVHRILTRYNAEQRNPHGTLNRYNLGCKCKECLSANSRIKIQQKINLKKRRLQESLSAT